MSSGVLDPFVTGPMSQLEGLMMQVAEVWDDDACPVQ
jgi:hypothetical protein